MRVSVAIETKAILPPDAPTTWDLPYLNLVVSGLTSLSPQALLQSLKGIERALGRDLQAPRWAPRIIDLDILSMDGLLLREKGLTLPHPELMNRPFLVNLMATLQSNWRYPVPGFPYSGKTLAEIVHNYIHFDPKEGQCFIPSPQMVGIVNVTPDSFSDGGEYRPMQRIQELMVQGAAIIDIGAQSTRPNARSISWQEEWGRLEPVLNLLGQEFKNRYSRPKISLDSFHPEVIQRAMRCYPIDWVNDVKGGEDALLLKIVAETECKIVLNHSLTVPASRNTTLPFTTNPIGHLYDWAQQKIKRLNGLGIDQSRIILDPGIGFGKSLFQSLSLLREIDALKQTGCEVLVGHSRKSFLKILSSSVDKDLETVGISHYLAKKGVDYLRVHNVAAHQQSLTASALLEGFL